MLRRTYLSTITALSLLIGTSTGGAAAPASMSSRQVSDRFAQCGYALSTAAAQSSGAYVVVRDAGGSDIRFADSRILIAIVYADAAAARAAHLEAHRQAEARLGEPWTFSSEHGPQLLAAYGASVWIANIALVQSSLRTLASIYSSDEQTGEVRIARPELLDLGFVGGTAEYGVDWDFVTCLEADAGLARAPAAAMLEPPFGARPGQPW